MYTKGKHTANNLYRVPENGKAELKNGILVRMSPTGSGPSRAGLRISASLLQHEEHHRGGYAYGDNTGFLVDLPNRQSFSPDAAWYTGYISDNMKFIDGAPTFAVEIRSEGDYGRAAEREISSKIADYFAAGTLVVWDVDLLSDDVVKVYRSESPELPVIFRRGDQADAEPAVLGWTFRVDSLFK